MIYVQPSAYFVDEILLENSHTHLFTDCLQLLPYDNRKVEKLQQRPSGLQSLKY